MAYKKRGIFNPQRFRSFFFFQLLEVGEMLSGVFRRKSVNHIRTILKIISECGFKLLQSMDSKIISFNIFKLWHEREGKFIQTLVFYFEMTWAGKPFRVIICYESFCFLKIYTYLFELFNFVMSALEDSVFH